MCVLRNQTVVVGRNTTSPAQGKGVADMIARLRERIQHQSPVSAFHENGSTVWKEDAGTIIFRRIPVLYAYIKTQDETSTRGRPSLLTGGVGLTTGTLSTQNPWYNVFF
jgi:hypothetical protein